MAQVAQAGRRPSPTVAVVTAALPGDREELAWREAVGNLVWTAIFMSARSPQSSSRLSLGKRQSLAKSVCCNSLSAPVCSRPAVERVEARVAAGDDRELWR